MSGGVNKRCKHNDHSYLLAKAWDWIELCLCLTTSASLSDVRSFDEEHFKKENSLTDSWMENRVQFKGKVLCDNNFPIF